ncbi:similar to Saccharomyces cerevisiae YGR089W NNF2 Protein that exhibits physical and genetic interactions with Rpb8p, which is a subunit of RNA polymerases I, II, and III [Maudiozyma saulgeensis]|uniref:Similar to Saccharomyces cerevisiae YGR089W NNF2 Protein that exhibits physical and genetic interactions with Rpb8p, which is a subunit of RNA polymerases I, II, and III n=1 Tax=Maudiozyma saulgeensis TaxID=1789683 RepID=A0A1X7QX13_9SACH|nr:similar to Saccharomyces cerevisiae YGR089W NNF2 Protein that exhibits physical and genetic interactions with Rpb8p, which is a subunit of RNA polymerases I, II, and III [Kazachstania saulgeensis]
MTRQGLGKVHQLRDTLALFAVFLSFNHTGILCLLIWFVLATTYKPLMSECLLRFSRVNGQLLLKNGTNQQGNIDGDLIDDLQKKPKKSLISNRHLLLKPNFDWLIFLLEFLTAILIRSNQFILLYFMIPLKSLSLAIIAATAINSTSMVPLYATFCSIIHATLTHITPQQWKLILPLTNNNNNNNNSNNGIIFCLAYHIVFRQFLTTIWLNNSTEFDTESNNITNQVNVSFSNVVVTNVQSFSQPPQNTQEKPSLTTSAKTAAATNQLYQIHTNLPTSSAITDDEYSLNIDSGEYDAETTAAHNLQTFVTLLFKRRKGKSVVVAPLWALCITLKALFIQRFGGIFQKNSLKSKILNSNDNSINNNNNEEETSMSTDLIAQNKNGDLNQLNLVPITSGSHATLDTIFFNNNTNINRSMINDYKVCIVDIAAHALTFLIENLIDGELIVLVNGLIWTEVSCTLVMERVGDEYVVISGLVPACSYDIQFVNRLNQKFDCLIADLMIRTSQLNNSTTTTTTTVNANENDISSNFEALDYSFPSYYHRKFLSPLLTLKHSVLTTNANLSDERNKIKKTRREINKKISSLRTDIDHLKLKLKQTTMTDNKHSNKIDTLKAQLQQNEISLVNLEETLTKLTIEENSLQDIYLAKKDHHLKKELEFDKLKDNLNSNLENDKEKLNKLTNDKVQFETKLEKLIIRHEKLQKELDSNNEFYQNFKDQFVSKREKSRLKRKDFKIREINDLELSQKALEQDLSRLEYENDNMKNLINQY